MSGPVSYWFRGVHLDNQLTVPIALTYVQLIAEILGSAHGAWSVVMIGRIMGWGFTPGYKVRTKLTLWWKDLKVPSRWTIRWFEYFFRQE